MATDPYAAIRRFRVDYTPAQSYLEYGDGGQPFMGGQAEAFRPMLPEGWGGKYAWADPVTPGDRSVLRVGGIQQPGMHKYDTFDGIVRLDPATGEYVLEGDPWATRQTSGMDKFQDFVEKGGLVVGGTLAAGYGLSNMFPAAGGGVGTLGTIPAGSGAIAPIASTVPTYVAPSIAGGSAAAVGGVSGAGLAAGGGVGTLGAMQGGAGAVGGIGSSGALVSTVPSAVAPTVAGGTAGTVGSVGGSSLAQQALMRAGTSLAGNIIGGRLQGNAAQDASQIQMRAAGEGQSTIAAMLKPYIDAGVLSTSAEMDLLGLNGPDKQAGALAVLENSPQFSQMVKQGEGAILGNASATGGLRGGNVQAALRDFRPQVLNQLVEQQLNRLGQMSQRGQGAATGGASGIANLQQQSGAAQAGGALARGQERAGYIDALSRSLDYYFGAGG
jgi:hypothetical protein